MQIRPLEEAYKFGAFFSSLLNESDFHAKPSVLLLGQYSTGTSNSIHFTLLPGLVFMAPLGGRSSPAACVCVALEVLCAPHAPWKALHWR